MKTKTHTIKKIEELNFDIPVIKNLFESERRFKLCHSDGTIGTDYKVKLRVFPKGEIIEMHDHQFDGRIYKLIYNPTGYVKYGLTDKHEPQDFKYGEVAWVNGDQEYDSEVIEDTIMILIEPKECKIKTL